MLREAGFFCKDATAQSDVNNSGDFAVPKHFAETMFFSDKFHVKISSVNLISKDVHGEKL